MFGKTKHTNTGEKYMHELLKFIQMNKKNMATAICDMNCPYF